MVGHLWVDQDFNDLDWWETQRRYADGSFAVWDTTATTTFTVAPHCIDWINNYYRFEARNGGC